MSAALVITLVTLAACGDDTASDDGAGSSDGTLPVETVPPVDTQPPVTTTPAPAGIEHPTGADDVVVRIAYEGGFVPVEYVFRNLPVLLLSGDGRLFQQGAVPEIYPGPLVSPVIERSVTEDGIQDLLTLADEHGLLADVEYTSPTNIADASDTVVEISANGRTYVHRAYALGLIEDEQDPARADLAAFVSAATGGRVTDWLYVDNPELGTEHPFAPDTYLVRALPTTETGGEIAPTLIDWPADSSIRLADASDCAAIPAAEVEPLFDGATQLTYFVDAGVTYQLSVKPQLPGDACG